MTSTRRPVTAELLGHRFTFHTSPGLFSAVRVDDGTRLLLDHLPEREPEAFLDLGCGYGALGLPIAARFPRARALLADRDLLAVEAAAENARASGLTNVTALGSLGYRDVGAERFDWILCNVPARIGPNAIRYILGGAARLNEGGELRVVVIRDLAPVVESVGLPIDRVADGSRHVVFRVPPIAASESGDESIYALDEVELSIGRLQRPHDLSEDPDHLRTALPLLLDCLPKHVNGKALVWRGGYGAAAIALARAGASVVAADRDLLATAFTHRNAERRGVKVATRDVPWPARLDDRFSLVVCEPSVEPAREIRELLGSLEQKGSLLWLGQARVVKSGLADLGGTLLASRGRWSLAELRKK